MQALSTEQSKNCLNIEFVQMVYILAGCFRKSMKGTFMKPSHCCNHLAHDVEGWLLRYLTTCAAMSPNDVSLLEHRICGAVLVSGLAGSDPSISELSATLGVPKSRTSRCVKRMIKDGRLSVLSDPDDDRVKRLQHQPVALEAVLRRLGPLYGELRDLLAGHAAT